MDIVTIDGPSGTGKTAISKKVSKMLGYNFFSIGYLYRTLTYIYIKYGTYNLEQYVSFGEASKESNHPLNIYFRDENITNKLHSDKEIDKVCPILSKKSEVRLIVYNLLQKILLHGNWILEGRSAGKLSKSKSFFLTCSQQERSNRIIAQRILNGMATDKAMDMVKIAKERNLSDLSREIDPLRIKLQSIIIDSTLFSQDETVETIMKYIKSPPERNVYIFTGEELDKIKKRINEIRTFDSEFYMVVKNSKLCTELCECVGEILSNVMSLDEFNEYLKIKRDSLIELNLVCFHINPDYEISIGLVDKHKKYHRQISNAVIRNIDCMDKMPFFNNSTQNTFMGEFTQKHILISQRAENLNNGRCFTENDELFKRYGNTKRFVSIFDDRACSVEYKKTSFYIFRDILRAVSKRKVKELYIIECNTISSELLEKIAVKIQDWYYKNLNSKKAIIFAQTIKEDELEFIVKGLLNDLEIGYMECEIWNSIKQDVIEFEGLHDINIKVLNCEEFYELQ